MVMVEAGEPDTVLSERQLAKRLGVGQRTLQRWRTEGNGPVYLRLGKRIAYLERDVESWLTTRRCRSTSDQAA